MDNLSSLSWTAASKGARSQTTAPVHVNNSTTNNNNNPRASPAPSPFASSATATATATAAASRPSSTLNAPRPASKAPSPAGDSFAGLLSLNSSKNANSLSLQDRQKQLLQEKAKQEQDRRQKYAQQFGADDQSFWDNLGSRNTTPQPAAQPSAPLDADDDLLAAFNSSAPVDRSSHFPPPAASASVSAAASGRNTPAYAPAAVPAPAPSLLPDDDDDPFGLGALPRRSPAPAQSSAPSIPTAQDDDDDILGDLGKPVTAKPPPRESVDDALSADRHPTPPPADSMDRPTAELVDMGFPADTSRLALQETGGDVQAAVGWLLNQAHEESRQRSQARGSARPSPVPRARDEPRRGRDAPEAAAMPAWMRQESRPSSAQRRQDNSSPATDKDVAAFASEIGTSFLKSANSLWKTGQKKMQKAVAEFQADADPNTPKWMRDASADRAPVPRGRQTTSQSTAHQAAVDLTNEAMLLETGERPHHHKPRTPEIREPVSRPASRPEPRAQSPGQGLPVRRPQQQQQQQQQPRFMQQAPQQDKRPAAKLTRLDIEEQTSQAYISPARRKRPAKPEPQPEPEVDLFGPAPVSPPSHPAPVRTTPAPRPAPAKTPASTPQPSRPRPAPRNVPAISSSAMSTSSTQRRAGTEAFKRGDYDAAHNCYTAALTPVPPTHPLVIVVLSNRALTGIKTGDPKSAVADADRALEIIGASKGEGEKIDLGGGEGEKDMKDFYGKALMRKAEALENMEKWSDAAKVWRDAVSAGVGGAVSLRARDRCEKAAGGGNSRNGASSSAPKAVPSRPASAATRSAAARPPAAVKRPAVSDAQSADAVRKLREANAAADRADDEKFALIDQVEAKVAAWKGGKADNLRALLGSLDTVLWPEAGWKKVGMSDLIMPNKVKIIYMKAIAKVHPDKISQTATTEQRMISGAVFSTLNEAWDKFKKDNGL